MEWVNFTPVDVSYGHRAHTDQIVTRLDGGRSWRESVGTTSAATATITWRVHWSDYGTLIGELTTGLPVLIEVYLFPTPYGGLADECVCFMVPDSLSLVSMQGDAVTVSAEYFIMTAASLRQDTGAAS